MRAIGYVRVSTDEQRVSGLGLEAQRAAIAVAAKRLELDLDLVEADEGVSGALDPHDRPALSRVLEELDAGDVLLVAKRDRLGRDLLQIAILERELLEKGVRVVSAAGEGTENDEPASKLMRRILDAFAEYELDMIRERTKRAARAKKARGERLGSAPFGYDLGPGGVLVEDLEELRALGLMQRLRDDGATFREICERLEADEIKPKRGARWYVSSVRSILANAARRRA